MKFLTEKISPRITRIFAFSTELMYLVEGDHKSALLDTGSGIGSLKECVQKLTDKPIVVLTTHGHVDHAMGSAEFSDVYLSFKDEYIYNEHGSDDFRKRGLALSSLTKKLSDKEIIPTAPFSLFKDLKGGDVFDLGGVNIEIYDCPGHTKGSVVMLIKEEKTLLLGDACNTFTFMFDTYSSTITEYKKSLQKLKLEVEGKYDKVLLSHGNGVGTLSLIDEVIEVCDDILSGNTDDIPFKFMGTSALIAKDLDMKTSKRVDGKSGNIVYNKNKIV